MPEVAAAAAAEPAPAFNIFAAPAANAAQAVSGIAQAAANTGQAVQVDILPPDFEETPDEAECHEPQNPSPFEKDAGFDEGAEQSSASRPTFSMPVDDGRDAPSADWRLDLMRRIRDEGPEAEAGETIQADDAEITNEVRPVTPVEIAPADDTPVNIFAAPRAADPSPKPRPNPEVETPRTIENAPASAAPQASDDSPGRSRFDALLSRIQEGPKVNAPAEEPRADLSPLDSDGSAISAVELANLSKASSVADLLAASAAWLTLVKGSGRFSRREVMQVFDDLPGDHPKTLEARIKGYGKLVRSGTLMLVDDGVFAMAQSARDDYQMLLDQR